MGIVSGNIGKSFGITYLFLDPEYLNKVNWLSFFIVGLGLSAFTISFQVTSYILCSYRYNFLANLQSPFVKYALNNSIIPFAFTIYYIFRFINFQLNTEAASPLDIITKVLGFIIGYLIILVLSYLYFKTTNLDIVKHLAENVDKTVRKSRLQRVNVMDRLNVAKNQKPIITSYIDFPLSLKKTKNNYPIDRETILKVFDQNQLNALLIQFFAFISILIFGLFRDVSWLQIPAAVSVLLLFSILLLFTGAVYYWLKDWAIPTFLFTLILVSFISKNISHNIYHQAFGLDYSQKAEYSLRALRKITTPDIVQSDKKNTIEILENWRGKFPKEKKPKLVVIAMSGGGQRAAVWTMKTLQFLDSAFQQSLMSHTMLMTGSSGGLIGGSFYRELFLRKQHGENIQLNDEKYIAQLAKDKLNPMVFSLVVGDLFFKFQKVEIDGQKYFKDRGYALEEQLNKDTDFILNKRLKDYNAPEFNSEIPMLMITPTVVNDGRKLYISSQPVAYMCKGLGHNHNHKNAIRGIEYSRLFANQNPENLRFITALRLNATFPYITPNVQLPSEPTMEIVDAGLSDNFGVMDAIQFIHVFKDWIEENTSGVVLITIRDTPAENQIDRYAFKPLIESAVTPLDNLLGNLTRLQNIRNDFNVEILQQILKKDFFAIVEFQYLELPNNGNEEVENASLSWRLTSKEIKGIVNAIHHPANKNSFEKLKKLMKE
ncbi:patatin-like phospholipase family protein [Flexithrix dorotheae]|uniref:patatin-like phospholipase family protein n=1 Tax=Flexithrix dorotheae TaxID=70993 RepID=UPI00146C1CD5|nr:patatin-like phospholipase family protein [Flexithrix dorotheae]